jgi:hypothetical protein
MSTKNIVGIAFVMSSACVALLGYRLLGTGWYVGLAALGGVGLWLLWSAKRDRQLGKWILDDAVADDAMLTGDAFSGGDD